MKPVMMFAAGKFASTRLSDNEIRGGYGMEIIL